MQVTSIPITRRAAGEHSRVEYQRGGGARRYERLAIRAQALLHLTVCGAMIWCVSLETTEACPRRTWALDCHGDKRALATTLARLRPGDVVTAGREDKLEASQ